MVAVMELSTLRSLAYSGGAVCEVRVDKPLTPSGHAGTTPDPPLAARLARARHDRFVGRQFELQLLCDALAAAEPSFSVLHVHGPGGIGKSALLDEYARLAREQGRPLVRLERLERLADREVVAALRAAAGAPAAPLDELPDWPTDPVLLIDHAEGMASREAWLRTLLLPKLPARTLVVIGSRRPPSRDWLSDLAWGALTRTHALRNLSPPESESLLTLRGVPSRHHAELLSCTHGHPLALTLAAEELRRRGGEGAFSLRDAPDAVQALLSSLVDATPSADHRRALQLLTMIWATSESLLAQMLPDADAKQLFEWLRGLSFVEASPLGLVPHDLVREVLEADFRWRDQAQWSAMVQQLVVTLYERLLHAEESACARIWVDILYLERRSPVMKSVFDWDSLHATSAERARPEHHAQIVAAVRRHEGAAAATVAGHWLARQPQAFWVFCDHRGQAFGFMANIDLQDATAQDKAVDPAVPAVLSWTQRHAPARQGEAIQFARFWMHFELYQQPSAAINMTAAITNTQWSRHPRLAWTFVSAAFPQFMEPTFSAIHYARVPQADYAIGDCRQAVFAHDWRVEPARQWFWVKAKLVEPDESWTVVKAARPLIVLSEPEFAQAVKRALRDFASPQALGANPLLRSRLTTAAGPETEVETLRSLLRDACESLRSHHRDEKLYQVLRRTFLEPAPSQERAAEALELPFSTYRYQLGQGVERVTRWLWAREIDAGAHL